MQNFLVSRWAAWAPGLETQDAWHNWFDQKKHAVPLEGVRQPELREMPAMARRRIDPLGRAALQAAYWAQGGESGCGPVVFASRWGEIARSLVLLQQLAQEESLSPTQFSLSVHNANGAQYSMARQDRQNYVAVSAGGHSAEAGMCEALGLLAEGSMSVLLVCFDAPLPREYAALGQINCPPTPYAWACVLKAADEGSGISLSPVPGFSSRHVESTVPFDSLGDLELLGFLTGKTISLQRQGRQGGWLWTRAGS